MTRANNVEGGSSREARPEKRVFSTFNPRQENPRSALQLTRSAAVAPALRATASPHRTSARPAVEWASGLTISLRPSSSARRAHLQSRSSRYGLALISTATPCSAQALSTCSRSTAYPGRANRRRPVGCPSTRQAGCSDTARTDPFGLLLLRQPEVGVDRGHHVLETLLASFGNVESSIGQNVRLEPLDDPRAACRPD